MRPCPIRFLLPAIALLLSACGGGGGGAGDVDLSGWWVLAIDKGGGFQPLSVVGLGDEGATVWLEGLPFARDGDVLRGGDPDRVSPDRTEYDLTILNGDLLEGAGTGYTGGAYDGSIPERLTRTTTPDGTLTIDGLIGGVHVARGSTTAHAEQEAGTAEHTIRLVDSRPHGVSVVRIYFPVPAPLVTGTWPLGGLLGTDTVMEILTDGEFGSSLSGNITFTSFAGGRIVGTYSVSLAGGGDGQREPRRALDPDDGAVARSSTAGLPSEPC